MGVKSFTFEDETYYINTETISAVRAERLLQLAPNLSVSMELLDVHSLLTSIFQDLSNITRLGDVINITNKVGNILMETNQKTAGQLLGDQVQVVYDICALCIVIPGEDTMIIDNALMTKKIAAWRRTGDFVSFFLIARELSNLFRRPSKKDSQKD